MKQLLCAVMVLTSYMAKAQSNQWQLCNTNACGSFNHAIIESSDTLFSSGCISVDDGLTWYFPPNGVHAYSYLKTSAGMFDGGDSAIYFSGDNGASWSIVHILGVNSFVEEMANLNDTVFAATLYHGIWMSPDDGLTWTAVNSGLPTDSIWSLHAVGNRLYAGTIHNGVYFSDNAGASWTAANNGLPPNATVRSMANDNINIYASATGGIYFTTIGGNSWTQLAFPVTNATVVFCVDNAILAGGYSDLYRSLDQGQTWNPFDAGFPDTCSYGINSLYATDNHVICGFGESFCFSTEIYRLDRSDVTTSVAEVGANDLKIDVFPNPFVDEINFMMQSDADAKITIYDLTGRKIIQQAFMRNATLNTRALDNSIYFYEVNIDEELIKTGKIIK